MNRDASLFCAAPDSGAVARRVAAARSVRFGSAFRPAAASLGGLAGRSRRRNKPGRGRNSCTPPPGCGSLRTRKTVPIRPCQGRRRIEQVDERHNCRDIDPACVPSTSVGHGAGSLPPSSDRRRACPSIRARLYPQAHACVSPTSSEEVTPSPPPPGTAQVRLQHARARFTRIRTAIHKEARAWEYSSFRRCVAAGLYPLEWGGTEGDEIYGGEREWGYGRDGTQRLKPAAGLRWRAGARPTLAAAVHAHFLREKL